MWTTPGTRLCTWLAGVCAASLASAMVTSSLAGLEARWADGASMASLIACMPTQQIPATLLAASRVDVVAARQWPCWGHVCSGMLHFLGNHRLCLLCPDSVPSIAQNVLKLEVFTTNSMHMLAQSLSEQAHDMCTVASPKLHAALVSACHKWCIATCYYSCCMKHHRQHAACQEGCKAGSPCATWLSCISKVYCFGFRVAPAGVRPLLSSVFCRHSPQRFLQACPHGKSHPHRSVHKVACAYTAEGHCFLCP